MKQFKSSSEQISRRNLLKFIACGAITNILPLSILNNSIAAETIIKDKSKVLTIYFSRTGNTKSFAEQVNTIVGGDIIELKNKTPYPADYRSTTDQAKKELESNFRPEIILPIDNIDAYDTIFIGYPNWWGTLPMAFFSFFEQNNLTGKTIIPFCTHASGGLGRGTQDIINACPQTNILEGLAIKGNNIKNSSKEIENWLRKINFII